MPKSISATSERPVPTKPKNPRISPAPDVETDVFDEVFAIAAHL
jgi:hypothetical protein